MKIVLLSIFAFALSTSASAQFVIVDDELPVLASDIDKITYEENDRFSELLLPACLANNPKTTIFSQALQLTGLADTLQAWNYDNYHRDEEKYKFQYGYTTQSSFFNEFRFKMFNVFIETDSVLAVYGIHNLEQLKAYAKQVYDETFPEDVSVSDPTDRRNSLNRFVSYHILGHGNPYWYLTSFNGDKYFTYWQDVNMADMSAWYATLMPHAALKCSYPMGEENRGLFINRRGLKDGPDKYGKLVRGVMILADGEQGFDHKCFNGYYFYIDGILAYDKTTRDEVLGSELWRMDFKTLSPDIMNDSEGLRGDYDTCDCPETPDPVNKPWVGWDHIYRWDCMENITGDMTKDSRGLVATRAHKYYWDWQGDAVYVIGDYDMTIKLPPLPAGEWEVRLGTCAYGIRGAARFYLNGEVTIDSLNMSKEALDDLFAQSKCMKAPRECTYGMNDYLADRTGPVRYPLGRIKSDGKSDNYLRIESLTGSPGNTSDAMFDYFEFVPKFVYDNQEIPEE